MGYKIVKIPKGKGRFRLIYAPDKRLKLLQKDMILELERLALKVCPPGVVYGFWPARSCVSNAQQHIGYQYTVCMDLEDFFDSCTEVMFKRAVGTCDPVCFANGIARQGFPSSPAISNICAASMESPPISKKSSRIPMP